MQHNEQVTSMFQVPEVDGDYLLIQWKGHHFSESTPATKHKRYRHVHVSNHKQINQKTMSNTLNITKFLETGKLFDMSN